MLNVRDIMTGNPITLNSSHSLKNAHDLMSAKGIRHIPVVDKESGKLSGIVPHREIIASIIRILSEHGSDNLIEYEMKTNISSLAVTDFEKIYVDQPLKEVVQFFISNKYGCLPVLDRDENLVGILTSSDFVKLSAKLLEMQ